LKFFSAPNTFSNALSPVQAAIITKAFEIIDTPEGKSLRNKLMTNILSLRNHLRDAGLDYYGDPSAIVCVKMGTEGLARIVRKPGGPLFPDLCRRTLAAEHTSRSRAAACFA